MAEAEEFSDAWRLTKMRETGARLVAMELGLSHWREVLETIHGSADRAEACARLSAEFGLDEVQATVVVDMQFPSLFRVRTQARRIGVG